MKYTVVAAILSKAGSGKYTALNSFPVHNVRKNGKGFVADIQHGSGEIAEVLLNRVNESGGGYFLCEVLESNYRSITDEAISATADLTQFHTAQGVIEEPAGELGFLDGLNDLDNFSLELDDI
ncbi:MAG: hypothetical protein ABIA75_13945 [Candidatus Neomarinimicrobiota bacterium]